MTQSKGKKQKQKLPLDPGWVLSTGHLVTRSRVDQSCRDASWRQRLVLWRKTSRWETARAESLTLLLVQDCCNMLQQMNDMSAREIICYGNGHFRSALFRRLCYSLVGGTISRPMGRCLRIRWRLLWEAICPKERWKFRWSPTCRWPWEAQAACRRCHSWLFFLCILVIRLCHGVRMLFLFVLTFSPVHFIHDDTLSKKRNADGGKSHGFTCRPYLQAAREAKVDSWNALMGLEALEVMPMLPASTWDSHCWGRRWWRTAGETSSVPGRSIFEGRWCWCCLPHFWLLKRFKKLSALSIWKWSKPLCFMRISHEDFLRKQHETPRFLDRFHHFGCLGLAALRHCSLVGFAVQTVFFWLALLIGQECW